MVATIAAARGTLERQRAASAHVPVKKTPIAITEVLTSAPATSGDTSCPSLPQAEARPKPEPRSDGGRPLDGPIYDGHLPAVPEWWCGKVTVVATLLTDEGPK